VPLIVAAEGLLGRRLQHLTVPEHRVAIGLAPERQIEEAAPKEVTEIVLAQAHFLEDDLALPGQLARVERGIEGHVGEDLDALSGAGGRQKDVVEGVVPRGARIGAAAD
jgi:hypothetical protein